MSLQILILGLLSKEDHHPYSVKKMINKYTKDVIQVTDGNLYYNFDFLHKKGLIQKVQDVQGDSRPSKTTYGITEEGRKALEENIYETFKHAKSIQLLYSSLLFIDLVDRSRLSYMVNETILEIKKKIEWIEALHKEGNKDLNEPRTREYIDFIVINSTEGLKTELNAFERLLLLLQKQ
ncbi:PadR family transcriptional regulator [Cohnella sp. WQ 127256]|uniref:PadR family transcriptional regulator n=1 Tax=Cohnella sp. WQ 127256 TaxID=2938790 RepID=UPI0021191E7D|nr:PadR family transcriptional regulator [Cohnella sp. WQ 127256]